MAFPSTYKPTLQMNGMLTVRWAEFITDKGSSQEAAFSYADGNQATLTIFVYDADLEQAIADLLGSQEANFGGGSGSNTLDRVLPAQHPRFSWLFCSRVSSVKPYRFTGTTGPGGSQQNGRLGGKSSQYDLYLLTCVFTQPKFALYTDAQLDAQAGGGPRPEWLRYTERIAQPTTFVLSREAGQSFRYVEDNGAGQPPANTNVPVPQPQFLNQVDYNLMWRRVPYIGLFGGGGTGTPDNQLNGLSAVNDAAFLGFPAGTLLFKTFRVHPYEDPVSPSLFGLNVNTGQSSLVCDVELVFTYFNPPSGVSMATNHGHNLAPWRDNRWYLVKDTATLTNKIYQEYDFAKIFEMNP